MTQPLDIRGVAEITDRVSPTLAKIGAAMAGISRNPSLKKVAADVGGVSVAFQGVGRSLGGVGHGLQSVAWNFAAVGSLAALAAVSAAAYFGTVATAAYTAAKSFATTGAEASDMAVRLGTSVVALQEWRYAASASGTTSAVLDRGLGQLQKTMADVSRGKAKDAAALFRKLGVSVKDAKGHIKPLETILPQLAQAFEKNKDPAMRARMALALFGESGAQLVPMLSDGRQGLEELAAKARQLGIIIPEGDVKRAKSLKDSLEELSIAGQGLGISIGSKLQPVLEPMIQDFTKWLEVNRDWVGLKLEQAVIGLRDAFAGFDLQDAIAQTERGFKRIDDLVTTAGANWKFVFGGLAALIAAPLVAPLVQLAVAVGRVGFAITSAGGALVAAGGWPVILGLLAIAGALKNWDEFSAGVERIWSGFGKLFQGDIFGAIKDIWGGNFDALKALVRGLLSVIDETFGTDLRGRLEAALSWLGGWLDTNLYGPFLRVIERIKSLWATLTFSLPSVQNPAPNGSRGQPANPGDGGAPATPPGGPPPVGPPSQYRGRYGSLNGERYQTPELITTRPQYAAAQRGTATVNVKFQNAPPGTKADVRTDGGLFGDWDLDMGYRGAG
ncbi:phage tail tape measure protein [Ancylobacter oerskovii]|uniref:Phage tail tape measure protein n=1 Tax=Ancylobacter oerskovii TaxID=459519 RepID=A0ABW4Z2X2_9HYPH|nr:phage tail tape measure protein [Ancylobacter oerskovii]MBS7546250.1 phage tail tape measure protein [Ancylobacter oerskovii]